MEKEMKKKIQNKELEELQSIRSLIILQLIRDGASSEEISKALKIREVSPSNIRTKFHMKKFKRKNGKKRKK